MKCGDCLERCTKCGDSCSLEWRVLKVIPETRPFRIAYVYPDDEPKVSIDPVYFWGVCADGKVRPLTHWDVPLTPWEMSLPGDGALSVVLEPGISESEEQESLKGLADWAKRRAANEKKKAAEEEAKESKGVTT